MFETCKKELEEIKDKTLEQVMLMPIEPKLMIKAEQEINHNYEHILQYLDSLKKVKYKFPSSLKELKTSESHCVAISGIKRYLNNLENTPTRIEAEAFKL